MIIVVDMIRFVLCSSILAVAIGVMVDLTHYNDKHAQTFPINRRFQLTITQQGYLPLIPKLWLQNDDFTMASHTGTHMDAPRHFNQHGWTIEQIPVDRFVSPLVVIDHQQRSAQNPNDAVKVSDILKWEEEHGRIPPGAMVVSLSGWAKKYKDDAAYYGTPNFREWPNVTMNYPGFSEKSAMFLTTEREIYGAGTDTLSLDVGNSMDFPAHVEFAKAGVILIENIGTGIHKVPVSGAMVITLPIKNKEASGAPVRMVAYWGRNETRFDGLTSDGTHLQLGILFISVLVILITFLN